MKDRIDVGSCVSRSWALYKDQFGLIFFTTLIINVASSAASGFPYIGIVAGLALNGVLYGGLFWFYLKLIRGQKAELPDAFAGFQREFVQLLIGSVVVGFAVLVAMAIAGLPTAFSVIPVVIKYLQNPELDSDILVRAISIGAVFNLIFCFAVAAFLSLLWIFTFPLIIDKRFRFWEAMETSRKTVWNHFSGILGLGLAGLLLSILGALACCIGIFFTIPVIFGSFAYAYEDLFGAAPVEPASAQL